MEGGALFGQSGPTNPLGVGQVDNERRVALAIANAGVGSSSWGLPETRCLAPGFSRSDDGCIR